MTGKLFDIQGFSVHDGPGARTLIFLRGCTLRCFWCSNPEGISQNDFPLYYSSKCTHCKRCIKNCIHHAIEVLDVDLTIKRNICHTCKEMSCLDDCYSEALVGNSKEYTVNQLMRVIERDSNFWGSNGGITLTGGEPLLQIDFVNELLKRCYDSYIHTAIETCGNIPWNNFERVLPYLDWIFFDIKHIIESEHIKGTGASNNIILENIKNLTNDFKGRLIFRLPLIPGFNDDIKNLNGIVSFIGELPRNEINILPLHHLGREKYQITGMKCIGMDYKIPSNGRLAEIKNYFISNGIECYVGDQTPF